MVGLCPFHAEKSPSFSVSPVKQFYYCFGCSASGDAIRFLTEHTGMSFVDAVTELAQGVGLQVPQEQVSPEERQRRQRLADRRLSLTAVLERAAEFYRAQLRDAPVAIDYLKSRGLTGRMAARFGLGYAPPGWHALAGVFADYEDPVLDEAGLVRNPDADESGSGAKRRYDWFRHRVIFPIRAVDGQVIGFGGRVLDDSKPKYMNSPETAVFNKGRELYGLFEARQAIRERGHCLVVEGYMDVVALAQCGFANAVATLGTACTAEHVQKLFRVTDSVVFSFDGDAAGRRAAARALEAALPHATDLRRVRFLFLPPEHDPDSYVRELGAEAFEVAIEQSVPLSRQLLAQASEGEDLDSAEGRARSLARARPLWEALPDGAIKRQLLADLAQLGRLGTDDLGELWRQQPKQPPTGTRADARRTPPLTTTRAWGSRRAPTASADLALRLLLRHADWWDHLSADDHQLLHELSGIHGALVAWLEQQLNDHGPMPWSALDAALHDHELHAAARKIVDADSLDDRHERSDLQRVVNRLWIDRLRDESERMVAEGRTDREHLERLNALHERLRHLKAEVASPAR